MLISMIIRIKLKQISILMKDDDDEGDYHRYLMENATKIINYEQG